MGVSFGHVHVIARDVRPRRRSDGLQGVLIKIDGTDVKSPGAFVFILRDACAFGSPRVRFAAHDQEQRWPISTWVPHRRVNTKET
jgi:hypothetical protein